MLVRFWGVRGSIPTPLSPEQVQAKITAVVERISPADIASEEAKEKFIANLPDYLFGTVGGNSACVELRTDTGKEFILDCGSGLRSYCKNGIQPGDKHYYIFMSHFHWDHIQGLPFFDASFNPSAKIEIYSTFPAAERILEEQSRRPYFPKSACWPSVKKQFTFHLVEADKPFYVKGVKVTCHKMKHPGNSYSFCFEENGKKFIYATDVELQSADFDTDGRNAKFFQDADMLILDSQYTVEEAIKKENWGHSSFCYAIDFAALWNVKNLYLFHHEPTYDDKKIYSILKSARWYAGYSAQVKTKVYLAIEGQEIEL